MLNKPLAMCKVKLTKFILHLIFFYGACPTAALVQTPGRQTCYFPPCCIVWKSLGVKQAFQWTQTIIVDRHSRKHCVGLWWRKSPSRISFPLEDSGSEGCNTDIREYYSFQMNVGVTYLITVENGHRFLIYFLFTTCLARLWPRTDKQNSMVTL